MTDDRRSGRGRTVVTYVTPERTWAERFISASGCRTEKIYHKGPAAEWRIVLCIHRGARPITPGQQTEAGVGETPNQHIIPVHPACEPSVKYRNKLDLELRLAQPRLCERVRNRREESRGGNACDPPIATCSVWLTGAPPAG